MDQFDGIQQHDAFLQNVGNDSYVPQERQRRRHHIVVGGALLAAVLLAVVVSTRGGSKEGTNAASIPSPIVTDILNSNGKYTFKARHPPAGVYNEVMTMNIVEDMSEVAGGLLGDSFAMELEMDSVKTMTDRTNHSEQAVKVHVTRVKSHIELGALDVDCDSANPPTKGMNEMLCDTGSDALGKDLEYIIDDNGDVRPQGHSGEIVAKSRVAKNPVEHVTNKLQFLPEGPVAIGDSWQSRVVLGDIGDFVGTTTLKRFADCGDGINQCALFTSVGTTYVDVREAAASLGMSQDYFDDLAVRESTMELNMNWDETNGMIRLSKTTMKFTIGVDNGIFGEGTTDVPVQEVIVMTSERQS